jgi:hypothetical protein
MSKKNAPKPAGADIETALAPPLPGGVEFAFEQEVIVIVRRLQDRVETLVEEANAREITRIPLDPGDALTAARRTWRRHIGELEEQQPLKARQSSKIGSRTPTLVAAIIEFVLHQGRYDTSLRPGTMATKVAAHASEIGLADDLAADGPLFHLCQAVQRILLQRKTPKTPIAPQKRQ